MTVRSSSLMWIFWWNHHRTIRHRIFSKTNIAPPQKSSWETIRHSCTAIFRGAKPFVLGKISHPFALPQPPAKCKWYGGLMGADGCIYGIPNCANSVSWLSNERARFAAVGCMRFVLSSSLLLIIYSSKMLYLWSIYCRYDMWSVWQDFVSLFVRQCWSLCFFFVSV